MLSLSPHAGHLSSRARPTRNRVSLVSGEYPVLRWEMVTDSRLGRSSWPGVGAWHGCASFALTSDSSATFRRPAPRALVRSICTAVWSADAAWFASRSAASIPQMPACPGTHCKQMETPTSPSSCSSRQTSDASSRDCPVGPLWSSWNLETRPGVGHEAYAAGQPEL